MTDMTKAETIAACVEMRAALEAALKLHEDTECAAPPCTCTTFDDARALLARTDLGRGMVAVPRKSIAEVRRKAMNASESWQHVRLEIVADLDALLGKVKL